MPLSVGDRLGSYEILAPIGAGGMGEVYRARDAKLERSVAIKVLTAALAQDPERLARFEREAKVLASLNHPNIAQIYGVEERALVMELVPGEPLKGPLPLETALGYARQIADALEAAHDKGIIHRDLKPANIMITPAGVVKVLDFGLAAVAQSSDPSNPANSPTLTISPTRAGMILGTAAYMSPEQARGKAVDKRADIWAFGVVLYEMLTGKRLFQGEDLTETLASVVKDQPQLDQAPPQVRRLLGKCLEKDPKKRLRDIGDAWALLEDPSASTVPARSWLWPATAAVCLLIAIAGWLASLYLRPKPHPALVQRFAIPAPGPSESLSSLSPDGNLVVFSAAGGTGTNPLWLRRLDSLEAHQIEGTEGARGLPFWSPDSRFIAFGTDGGKLVRIDISGGLAQALCDVGQVAGGFWTSDGRIVFGDYTRPPGLFEVSATGGTASPLPGLGQSRNVSPVLLPDGRHFVYVQLSSASLGDLYVGSLDGNPGQNSKKLLTGVGAFTVGFAALPDNPDLGHLLVLRGFPIGGSVTFASGTLVAQPLNLRKLELVGDPIPIAEQVSDGFSTSRTGILVYRTGGLAATRQLTLFDRQGKILGTVGEPGDYVSEMVFSPDGRRLIATRRDSAAGNENLWIFDLARGVGTRFTSSAGRDLFPVWSPDGSRIAFASTRSGSLPEMYQKLSNGGGEDELFFKPENRMILLSLSGDGHFLLVGGSMPAEAVTWVLPLDGNFHVAGKPVIFVKKGLGIDERFSPGPDGRPLWVAYQSKDSGRFEVYVRPFDPNSGTGVPPGSGVSQVSTAGGVSPRWSGNGKELFYMALDGRSGTVMSVDVSGNPAFQSGTPTTLFKPQGWISDRDDAAYWDVSSDGQKFLFRVPPTASAAAPAGTFTVVLNWTSLLKK
jgi:eukaryotic-like serine/threonine-protein kinase